MAEDAQLADWHVRICPDSSEADEGPLAGVSGRGRRLRYPTQSERAGCEDACAVLASCGAMDRRASVM